MTVKIDKGLPMPTRRSRAKYPWASLEIGDSFLLSVKSADGAHSMARKARLHLRRNFQARLTDEGWRVWRCPPK